MFNGIMFSIGGGFLSGGLLPLLVTFLGGPPITGILTAIGGCFIATAIANRYF